MRSILSILIFFYRSLVEKAVPGNRVTILGIYCIRKQNAGGKGRGQQKGAVGVRDPYIRVLGIEVDIFLCYKQGWQSESAIWNLRFFFHQL